MKLLLAAGVIATIKPDPALIYEAMQNICPQYTADCGFDPALHPPPPKPERT